MGKIQEAIKGVLLGIYTYSIMIGEDESGDKNASFFGNINEKALIDVNSSSQFLCNPPYVQRCNDPPVYNLITFGSPYNGVSDILGCEANDGWCRLMRTIASQGAYSGYIREHIIQA
ncbi:4506_t:CDS:2 [Gigaspora rosea]|nr:4506_t:CDS:2 [Gigaspora rosea]